MKLLLVTVSAALLCSHAFAASSYLGLAQGTPLGRFSQHGTLHGGLIPGGLYGNSASFLNHGLPLGHLPGPIYGSGGYLDYAYGTGAHFGNPYGKSGFLKYLYGNPLGLANPYGALRNVGVGGVNEAEDETSSTSGSGAISGADFVSNNQIGDSTLTGISGLHSSPIAGLGGFHSALLPHTSSVALGTHPYALGPHTSIASLGGFTYAAGHHDSLSAFSGILPNVGAAGKFPYGR
nr:prisilkin-39-like [Penaeus vannamei]